MGRSRSEKFAYEYGSKARVAFVAGLPCAVCGANPCHNHHVRADGMGRKGPRTAIVPLCGSCHNRIHSIGKLSVIQQMDRPLRLPIPDGLRGYQQCETWDDLAAAVEALWLTQDGGLTA